MEILGLAALPLTYRLFKNLPDKGYAFSKPLGLLLTSYVLWIGGTFGFLRNSFGGIILSIIVVGASFWWFYAEEIKKHPPKPVVIASEILFATAFALWSLYRAYTPDIAFTEKPMEFAFLNAILRSEHFPPYDPWLSGYAISYYYFGYIMVAMLTKLSGIPSSIAFNLGIALLFALTATGAFSVVYNLVARSPIRSPSRSLPKEASESARSEGRGVRSGISYGLLGALLVVVIGNLEGMLEVLHTKGIGSKAFWDWIDVKNLQKAPITGNWLPTDSWWWWRASRVIHDKDLLGRSMEVIDEFPFFSFMLGDMHPHVLALPFVLLAIGLALNILFRGEERDARCRMHPVFKIFGEDAFLFVIYALCLGGLSFLNTWDFPIYLSLVVASYTLHRWREKAAGSNLARDAIYTALGLFCLGVLLYLPFYIGFRTQAGGILPNLFNVTRLHQYLIMFGLFIFTLIGFLAFQYKELLAECDWREVNELIKRGILIWPVAAFAFPSAMLLSIAFILFTERGRAFLQGILESEAVQDVIAGRSIPSLIRLAISLRFTTPGLFLLLSTLITLIIILIARSKKQEARSELFTLLMALVSLLLTFSVEFVYLKDVFSTRMNTVFKLYYQAWVLLALSSAYGVYYTKERRRGIGQYLFLSGFSVLFIVGMVYPFAAGFTKAGGFAVEPTLDGMAYVRKNRPDEYAAIQWLNENIKGNPVILEATGGSFTEYGRISSRTGLPTLLGWDGHEFQWRGNSHEQDKRKPDIEAIYESLDIHRVSGLLEKYNITYVYIGHLERGKYGQRALTKFDRFMDLVFQKGDVRIYKRWVSVEKKQGK